MPTNLLLISNSTNYGSKYLDHCESALRAILGGTGRVLFVPYALADWDGYAGRVGDRLRRMGVEVESIHDAGDEVAAVRRARALFVGGGNTFRLLDRLYRLSLLDVIRERVRAGIPYVGSSAGSNVAGPTIKTTNDMPIVQPPDFGALGLVPFNINPHYLDPDPASRHMGETREQRIREFHEENDETVVALREGSMLRVTGTEARLAGPAGARVFVRNREPKEYADGATLAL